MRSFSRKWTDPIKNREIPKICISKALEGFFGWTLEGLNIFPVSVSRAKTDESLVATTKIFLSNPCKLHVLNCIDMTPAQSSLAICVWYSIVLLSESINTTCIPQIMGFQTLESFNTNTRLEKHPQYVTYSPLYNHKKTGHWELCISRVRINSVKVLVKNSELLEPYKMCV